MTLFANALLGSREGELNDKVTREGGVMPASPGGALSLGASPDAAKMIGTPAQKKAAFSDSLTKMRTEMSTARYEQETAQADKAKVQMKDRAARLGEAAIFAQQYPKLAVQYALSSAAAGNALIGSSIDWEMFNKSTSHLSQANRDGLRQSLDGLLAAKNPEDRVKLLADIAKYWGSIPDSATLASFFRGATAQDKERIRQVFATGTDDFGDITVGKIFNFLDRKTIEELTGFVSLENLAFHLRMDPEEAAALSFDDIKQRIKEVGSEFDSVGELKQKLTATTTSEPERMAALRQLREYGLVGSLSEVEKYNNLEAQMSDGEQVEFDGEMIRVEDLLGDEWLMDKVESALMDPAELERLRDFSPDFAQWVENNRIALEDEVANFDSARREVQDITKQVSELNKIPGVEDLLIPDTLMKEFIPGWGSTAFTSVPYSNILAYRKLVDSTIAPEEKRNVVMTLGWLQQKYPKRFIQAMNNAEELYMMQVDPMEYQDDVESFEMYQLESQGWKTADDMMKGLLGEGWKTHLDQLADAQLWTELRREPTSNELNVRVEKLKKDFSSSFAESGKELDFGLSPSDYKSQLKQSFTDALADQTRVKREIEEEARRQEAAKFEEEQRVAKEAEEKEIAEEKKAAEQAAPVASTITDVAATATAPVEEIKRVTDSVVTSLDPTTLKKIETHGADTGNLVQSVLQVATNPTGVVVDTIRDLVKGETPTVLTNFANSLGIGFSKPTETISKEEWDKRALATTTENLNKGDIKALPNAYTASQWSQTSPNAKKQYQKQLSSRSTMNKLELAQAETAWPMLPAFSIADLRTVANQYVGPGAIMAKAEIEYRSKLAAWEAAATTARLAPKSIRNILMSKLGSKPERPTLDQAMGWSK